MVKLFLGCITLTLVSTFSFGQHERVIDEPDSSNFYSQGRLNRVAAEWEPAVGTMIVWPLSLPYKLVIELGRDNHLYTLIANEQSKEEAQKWYTRWGIDSSSNTFIYAPQGMDSWWVRDWGPSAVFAPKGEMKLGDGKYIYSTPFTGLGCTDSLGFIRDKENRIIRTDTDDNATGYLGKALRLDVLDLPFVNTGGNVMTDGLGSAFSTCVLMNENKFYGVSNEKFFDLNRRLLGFNRYNIISNFEIGGIQHIDCFMKLLDEERILVSEPPQSHPLYKIYEDIVQNQLSKLITPYGRHYEIVRIKTGTIYYDLAAYTNSLILNKTIYVPLFKIKEDSAALKRWQELMPGYKIKGFEFDLNAEPLMSQAMWDHYMNYGWNFGDALHCRTRAVWDPQMLFISLKRIESTEDAKKPHRVHVSIIDYSRKGLDKALCKLVWRVGGYGKWNDVPLNQIEGTDHFWAELPVQKAGVEVEYYVTAVSFSGRIETRPRTVPQGVYKFLCK